MAVTRNPNNPRLALTRTQPPTPNETRSAINTANQCSIEIEEIWPLIKEMQAKIEELEKAAKKSIRKPTVKKTETVDTTKTVAVDTTKKEEINE